MRPSGRRRPRAPDVTLRAAIREAITDVCYCGTLAIVYDLDPDLRPHVYTVYAYTYARAGLFTPGRGVAVARRRMILASCARARASAYVVDVGSSLVASNFVESSGRKGEAHFGERERRKSRIFYQEDVSFSEHRRHAGFPFERISGEFLTRRVARGRFYANLVEPPRRPPSCRLPTVPPGGPSDNSRGPFPSERRDLRRSAIESNRKWDLRSPARSIPPHPPLFPRAIPLLLSYTPKGEVILSRGMHRARRRDTVCAHIYIAVCTCACACAYAPPRR